MKYANRNTAWRRLATLFPLLFALDALALDPLREASIHISVARLYRNSDNRSGQNHEEAVCDKIATAPVFDFQKEVNPSIEVPAVYCDTTFDGKKAVIQINSAIVLRTLPSGARIKQFRYHAVIFRTDHPNDFRDIYGRSTVTDPRTINMTVDSAYDPGPFEGGDGYWVTVSFLDKQATVLTNSR